MTDYHNCDHDWQPNGKYRSSNPIQGTWMESNSEKCSLCGLIRLVGTRRENNWSGD